MGQSLSRITTDPPSKGEVKKAILSTNLNKAPGAEGLTAEILKADVDTTVEILHPVLIKVWELETLPEDWNTGCIIPLPKEGDLSVCDNWRGITLLSVPSKILTHITMNRLKPVIEPSIRSQQNGFRPRRSCVGHIYTLIILTEQAIEFRCDINIGFIDFQRTFDKINHNSVWNALQKRSVPAKITNLIKTIVTVPTLVDEIQLLTPLAW
jgi:hypothetical protein